MAAYQTLENWMMIAAAVLGILAALSGYGAFRYGKLKAEAERMEARWYDSHPGVAAVSFVFYEGNNDLDYLQMQMQLSVVKYLGDGEVDNESYSLRGKESELYLPPGIYKMWFTSREYEGVAELTVKREHIGLRLGTGVSMKRRKLEGGL